MPERLRLRIRIEALSPLGFGVARGKSSTFVDTLDYVPGTSLRGAVAARFLREIGNPDDQRFRKIFIDGGVHFANLYPVKEAEISQVLPTTAYACKAYKERHGVKDALIRAAPLKLVESQVNFPELDEIMLCSYCRQSARVLTGFYEKGLGTSVGYDIIEVHKRHLTHVGINRKKQSAEKGFLFAHQVINEAWRMPGTRHFQPQLFAGDLIIGKEEAEFLTNRLLELGAELRMGESRTRGLGRVRVRQKRIVTPETAETLLERIIRFNRQLSPRAHSTSSSCFISLTLQSDAVLRDEFDRPRYRLNAADIHRAFGSDPSNSTITPNTLRLVYFNAGTRLVQTWNVASGYPKADNVAITMGSVFLFEATEGRIEDLAADLAAVQERGIGERRSEGFGRVTVCDEFHLEVEKLWRAREPNQTCANT